MYLKFIGMDGSMGLEHGKFYDVEIKTDGNYLVVSWDKRRCPYTFNGFVTNWAS
jgi:predicted DNA-binding WGR domain protein